MRWRRGVAVVALAAGCASSTSTSTGATTATSSSNGTGSSSSSTSGPPPPTHPLFPQVPNSGGPTLASPQAVLLTYGDDPNGAFEQAYLSWLLSSEWLMAVGADYGVSGGALASALTVAPSSPSNLSNDGVHALLDALFDDGGVAVPGPGSNVLFVLFVPKSVTFDFFGSTACQPGSVDSYHLWYFRGQTQVPYAVVMDCPGEAGRSRLEQLEYDTSHELIEAATDPFGFGNDAAGRPSDAWRITDAGEPFYAVGDELGDLCIQISSIYRADAGFGDAGFLAQRIYSNRAAAAGLGSPCIPAPPGEVFYTLATDAGVATLAPGDSVGVTLTGWTSDAGGSGPTWCVNATYPPSDAFQPSFNIVDGGPTLFQAGTQVQVEVGVPSGQPPPMPDDAGRVPDVYGSVLFQSQDCDAGTVMAVWPVQVKLGT